MTRMISIAIICGAAALTGAASSALSQTTSQAEYHYALPLNLAVEAATEAVRVCAQNGYQVSATVVDMDGVRQVDLRVMAPPFIQRNRVMTRHIRWSRWGRSSTLIRPASSSSTVTKTSPYAPRLSTMHNVMALPGAVAFKSKNVIVGALGVGGAPGGDKDEVCAQAGMAKVADRLPR